MKSVNEQPLISIIVPVYKVEQYLDRCVESIVNQTYKNLEIILVDDGSPDNCPQMCDDWAKKDSRIKAIHKENGGLSDARNAGISHAKGGYVSFVDSDDWLEPCFYEFLLSALIDNDCDVVGCDYRKCIEGKEYSSASSVDFNIKTYEQVDAVGSLIDDSIKQVVWNKLYLRQAIEGILFEKGRFHEDEFWTYQVLGRIRRYAAIDYVGYNYFQRSDSIMGEEYSIRRLDAIEAKVRRQKYLEEKLPELAVKGRVNLIFSCLYHGQKALKYLQGNEKKKVLTCLKKVVREHPIRKPDTHELSITHKMWLYLSCVSFEKTCRLRNICRVGM